MPQAAWQDGSRAESSRHVNRPAARAPLDERSPTCVSEHRLPRLTPSGVRPEQQVAEPGEEEDQAAEEQPGQLELETGGDDQAQDHTDDHATVVALHAARLAGARRAEHEVVTSSAGHRTPQEYSCSGSSGRGAAHGAAAPTTSRTAGSGPRKAGVVGGDDLEQDVDGSGDEHDEVDLVDRGQWSATASASDATVTATIASWEKPSWSGSVTATIWMIPWRRRLWTRERTLASEIFASPIAARRAVAVDLEEGDDLLVHVVDA